MPDCLYLYIINVHTLEATTIMLNVTITEFRANLLKYLKIAQKGEQINVTSKGASLATLTPPLPQRNEAKAKLRKLAKSAVISDIVSPTDESWDAMK